jgi:hypothetical protein
MSTAGLGTRNDYAGEDQQQFTQARSRAPLRILTIKSSHPILKNIHKIYVSRSYSKQAVYIKMTTLDDRRTTVGRYTYRQN